MARETVMNKTNKTTLVPRMTRKELEEQIKKMEQMVEEAKKQLGPSEWDKAADEFTTATGELADKTWESTKEFAEEAWDTTVETVEDVTTRLSKAWGALWD